MSYNRVNSTYQDYDEEDSRQRDPLLRDYSTTDGPLKPVPSIEKLDNNKKERRYLQFQDLGPLLVMMRIFFMSTPETSSVGFRLLFALVQLLIIACAVTANAISLWQFDLLPFQKLAESLYIARLLMAYVFLILHLKKGTLPQLVFTMSHLNPIAVRKLARKYAIAWVVLMMVGAAGVIPTYIQYSEYLFGGAYTLRMTFVLIGSALMYQAVWSGSLVIFWFNLHLIAMQWGHYVFKLKKGQFHVIHAALVEHALLTESISENNANWEVYLFCSLSFLIPSIMSSLYISLLPKYTSISIWTIGLFIDCGYLMGMFIPGAVITTRIRRVLKITNKLRAVTAPDDSKNIQQLESFLLYLYTNNASFKVAGVAVDLGFVTKLCLSLFSFCAFMVQRELAAKN